MRADTIDIPGGQGAARGPSALRRRVVRSVIGAGVLMLAALLTVLTLAWSAPGWWPRVDASDPRVAAAGADLENAVASEMSRVRPGSAGAPGPWRSDDWSVRIGQDEATAWLNTRLRKWLANRDVSLPDQIETIAVVFAGGEVRLGIGFTGGRVISARSRPELTADGALWLRGTRLYAGRMPLPRSWVSGDGNNGWLAGEIGAAPEIAGAVRSMTGRAAVSSDPVVALGDGRRVRVVGIAIVEGAMSVTCRTEAGPRAGAD